MLRHGSFEKEAKARGIHDSKRWSHMNREPSSSSIFSRRMQLLGSHPATSCYAQKNASKGNLISRKSAPTTTRLLVSSIGIRTLLQTLCPRLSLNVAKECGLRRARWQLEAGLHPGATGGALDSHLIEGGGDASQRFRWLHLHRHGEVRIRATRPQSCKVQLQRACPMLHREQLERQPPRSPKVGFQPTDQQRSAVLRRARGACVE